MLGGIIAGALAGGAKGVSDVAGTMLEKENKLDLAREMSKMDEEKSLRIDDITRTRNIEGIGRTAEATAAAAPIAARGVVAGRVAGLKAATDANLPKLEAENEVAGKVAGVNARAGSNITALLADEEAKKEKAIADALVINGVPASQAAVTEAKLKANKPNVTEQATQTGAAAAAQLDAEVGAPNYLKNVRAKKQAEHVETVGSVAQANLANFQLGRLKSIAALQDGLEKAELDGATETSKRLRARISSLGFSGKADVKTYLTAAETTLKSASLEQDPDEKIKLYKRANELFEQAGLEPPGQPKKGDIVDIPDGKGEVVEVNGKLVIKPIPKK